MSSYSLSIKKILLVISMLAFIGISVYAENGPTVPVDGGFVNIDSFTVIPPLPLGGTGIIVRIGGSLSQTFAITQTGPTIQGIVSPHSTILLTNAPRTDYTTISIIQLELLNGEELIPFIDNDDVLNVDETLVVPVRYRDNTGNTLVVETAFIIPLDAYEDLDDYWVEWRNHFQEYTPSTCRKENPGKAGAQECTEGHLSAIDEINTYKGYVRDARQTIRPFGF